MAGGGISSWWRRWSTHAASLTKSFRGNCSTACLISSILLVASHPRKLRARLRICDPNPAHVRRTCGAIVPRQTASVLRACASCARASKAVRLRAAGNCRPMEITCSSFDSKTLVALKDNAEIQAFQSVFRLPEAPCFLLPCLWVFRGKEQEIPCRRRGPVRNMAVVKPV